jgi:hypothetical protein
VRTLGFFGLDYETLSKRNPRLIYAWRGGKLSATTGHGTAQEPRDARAIESDLKRYRQLTTLAVRNRSRNRY